MKKLAALTLFVSIASFAAPTVRADQSKDLYLTVSPRVWGLDLGAGVSTWDLAPPLDTIFWVIAGGAWDNKGYFRNPADNSPYSGSISGYDPSKAPYYNRLDLRWRMGIEQGLVNNPVLPKDLLTTFLFVQAELSRPLQDSSTSQLIFAGPDSGDDVHVSALLGFKLDTVDRDPVTKVYRGYYAETSMELAPGPLVDSLTRNVNYYRLNLTGKYFLPVYEVQPTGRGNVFGLYLGDRFIADYLWGSGIPLSVRQQTGGISPADGMGDAVRGLEKNRFDANLKIINNLSLRATFPPLVNRNIVPGAYLFFDSGYYSGMAQAPAGPDDSGFVASAGAGLSVDFLDLGDASIYTAYLLTGNLVAGGSWTPISIELGLHY